VVVPNKSYLAMQDEQTVAEVQVLQGEVHAVQAADDRKYPPKHTEQEVALLQVAHPVEQAEQRAGVAAVTIYPATHPLALQVVVVPDETVQVAQFAGQARQALALTIYPIEVQAVQVVADVQVTQLAKQASHLGAVPQNPEAKQAVQAGVVPATVAHPVGNWKQAALIN